MSGRAVGGAGCVRGRGLLRGCGCVALLPCDLALRGIHRHLPDSEGPGAIVEQGQNGVECSHSVLKENCAEETLVSPSSPEPAGTLPSGGEGPSLRPAVAHPSPSSTAAAVLAPSISAKAGGRMGTRRRGASCMCLAEVTGSCF